MTLGKAFAAIAAQKVTQNKAETIEDGSKSTESLLSANGVHDDSSSGTHCEQKLSHKAANHQKSLMSTEKAAVAAMLAMKSSSDESDGDSISPTNHNSSTLGMQPSTKVKQEQLDSPSLIASV
jgi:hypothetical protein